MEETEGVTLGARRPRCLAPCGGEQGAQSARVCGRFRPQTQAARGSLRCSAEGIDENR
jgi:hypothetical protein